jgi:hypothetical protein
MAATREQHEAEKTWLKDRTSEVAKLWLRPYSAGDRLAAVCGERVGMEAKPLRRERGGGQQRQRRIAGVATKRRRACVVKQTHKQVDRAGPAAKED